MDDDNVVAPDVWWVPDVDRPSRDAERIIGAPGLAVEVRSPSTWRYDIGAKKRTCERLGLAELWLVDTAGDVVLELAGGEALTTPLLPGFTLDLAALFDR